MTDPTPTPTIETTVQQKAVAEGTGILTIEQLATLVDKFPQNAMITKFAYRGDPNGSWLIEATLTT